MTSKRLLLFPTSTQIQNTPTGKSLSVAGCDLGSLVEQYGSPLYVYDQDELDGSLEAYQAALGDFYPAESDLTYAGKAYLSVAIAQWAASRGVWLDCSSSGELHIAARAGVPRTQILVHGVNKSPADLLMAADLAGVIVVDNLTELERLIQLYPGSTTTIPDLWLRFRPGFTVDTHAYNQTGGADSKFGLERYEVLQAARLCQEHRLPLTGLHFHLGSMFANQGPVIEALHSTIDLAASIDLAPPWTICPGGGLGVAYHEDQLPGPSIREYVRAVAQNLVAACQQRRLPLPRLQLEPGRSLVARAGVALYRVGAVKITPNRRWILVDGGLADNPRPALYGARYSALPVADPLRPLAGPAWVGGPYCESGDVLIEGLPLPDLSPGELLAVPVSGAYQLSMSSNYNGARRPAVLWLHAGKAQLIQQRETLEDLVQRDQDLNFHIS